MKLNELVLDPILVLEGITIAQDKLRFSTTAWKETSTADTISTSFKRIPYKTTIKGSEPIYSILNYISSEETTKMLTSLKGKGPYVVNDRQLDDLIQGCVNASRSIIQILDPDIIVFPKSSSMLLSKFVNKLQSTFPKIKVVDEAFVKKVLQAGDEEAMVNTSHPDWKKFAAENPDAVDELKKSIARHIKDGNLELKKMYKPYVKFIKNFVQLKDAYKTLDDVVEKNVLVVDDLLSTGSTMLEMFRQLRDFEPKTLSGLTIFKRTADTHH